MPKKLSLQNAKKQVVEYMIYIITMVITVALLLSFNMIIFSEEIAAIINEKSILPLILITVSVLVVLVISALVKHITVFMVRKRSREFGLYMLLGVENNDIAKMFMFENYFIYVFVLIIGIFIGTLFYQILKAVICQMYATIYYFNFEFSSKAIILTLVYMGAIFSFVSISTSRSIRISDYNNLRDMLGLSSVVLDRNTYIIHCTVPNIAPFEKYTEEHTQLLIGDTICHFGGIYSEDFMQQESCGNGNGFLIIVPDKVSEVLYEQKNVLVVKTLSSLSLTHIEDLNHIDKNVLILSKTGVRNQSASMAVYTVLPLFYFAFVSAAIACTLLSVQILSWANKEILTFRAE